jgi:hypothetical protein
MAWVTSSQVRWGLVGQWSTGSITDGKMDDWDPPTEPRVHTIAETISGEVGGRGFGFSVSLPLRWEDGRLEFGVLRSVADLDLRMRDGYRVKPYAGPLDDLDSSYHTRWEGMEYSVRPSAYLGEWGLSFQVKFHVKDFSSEGNWNLREELAHPVSFTQTAEVSGWSVSLGGHRRLPGGLLLGIELERADLRADDGLDLVFFADGRRSRGDIQEVDLSFVRVETSIRGVF